MMKVLFTSAAAFAMMTGVVLAMEEPTAGATTTITPATGNFSASRSDNSIDGNGAAGPKATSDPLKITPDSSQTRSRHNERSVYTTTRHPTTTTP